MLETGIVGSGNEVPAGDAHDQRIIGERRKEVDEDVAGGEIGKRRGKSLEKLEAGGRVAALVFVAGAGAGVMVGTPNDLTVVGKDEDSGSVVFGIEEDRGLRLAEAGLALEDGVIFRIDFGAEPGMEFLTEPVGVLRAGEPEAKASTDVIV